MNCSASECTTHFVTSSSSVNDFNGLPGESIEEKTRSILGWTVGCKTRRPSSKSFDASPYTNRNQNQISNFRKSSVQDYSAPIRSLLDQSSGSKEEFHRHFHNEQNNGALDSKISPHLLSTGDILERFRREMPHLSKQRDKFKILVQTAINVIELETKLSQLKYETESLTKILNGGNIKNDLQSKELFTYSTDMDGNSSVSCVYCYVLLILK